jgi:hypothetical protein
MVERSVCTQLFNQRFNKSPRSKTHWFLKSSRDSCVSAFFSVGMSHMEKCAKKGDSTYEIGLFRGNRSRRESNPHLRFRKPPFYPLNYGNNDSLDFRFSTADCKLPCALAHQCNKPAAAGNFEFAEDCVEVLFHHRQT